MFVWMYELLLILLFINIYDCMFWLKYAHADQPTADQWLPDWDFNQWLLSLYTYVYIKLWDYSHTNQVNWYTDSRSYFLEAEPDT